MLHLRVFGCRDWYTSKRSQTQKLDAPSRGARVVGYAADRKAYNLGDSELCKVTVSRDVVFDELSDFAEVESIVLTGVASILTAPTKMRTASYHNCQTKLTLIVL